MAASIASVIMFACDELHFATGAQAMIHKPLCMAYGNADDFKAVIKQLNLCEDSILDVYMEHVQEGVTRDKIQSLMSNETYRKPASSTQGSRIRGTDRKQISDIGCVLACGRYSVE